MIHTNITTVYDKDMNIVAFLENAFKIGYKKKFNDLWEATFSLPVDDPKNDECQPFRFVEIFDIDERVDLFRILKPTKARNDDGSRIITYTCEHVLATLVDDVLDGYHQIGNLGIYTSDVIQYLLGFQTVNRWQLGSVDPSIEHQFEYKWEKEKTLLGPLFSITNPFIETYQWSWDTSTYPWALSLAVPNDDDPCYMRYGKNLKNIEQNVDASTVVTRLYCYGYGEGVNQLGISGVNPTGLPYIDADTQDQYGIISDIWVDKRFENAQSLYDTGKANLEVLKVPAVSYKADGAYIYQITKDPIDKFEEGRLVIVNDDTLNLEFQARVISVDRSDIKGDPGAVTLEIANKVPDVTMDLSNIKSRQDIHEVYAQGSTNLDTHDFADNCDPDHPAVIRFYVPEEAVHINKVMLNFELGKFRGYSQATKGGGAIATTTASGGGSTQTSSSGGGSTQTSSSGGGSTQTSSSGGGTTTSSSAGGDHTHLMFKQSNVSGAVATYRFEAAAGGLVDLQSSNQDLYTYGGSGNHSHSVTVPNHTHSVTIPNHTHSVNIPNHTHSVVIPSHTHSISLPDHTHEIQYGIYEGPQASSVTVKVDGNTASGDVSSDIDLLNYLFKDGDGKITRGWHEITLTPDDLSRINANVVIQLFVQSRGGEIL